MPASRNPRFETITSKENRWLKKFRSALRGGEMTEDGFVALEGPRFVAEALRSGLQVQAILVSDASSNYLQENDLLKFKSDSVPSLLQTSNRLFASIADTQSPQGIAALVKPRAWNFDDLLRGVPLVVVLVGVQDPGNVGTILRSAEAFGATGALLCRGTANPWTPKVLRASAGSALRLPLVPGPAAPIALAQSRVTGLKSCAASLRGTLRPDEIDLRAPSAIFVGNETTGLPADIEESADALVRIPISAGVDSLNAAAAASVLLYEAARQRRP